VLTQKYSTCNFRACYFTISLQ